MRPIKEFNLLLCPFTGNDDSDMAIWDGSRFVLTYVRKQEKAFLSRLHSKKLELWTKGKTDRRKDCESVHGA
jgi:hypothetical protein